ncbi:hypothetical protein FA95DRAFT_1609567 [Auriscalpium vulgare]|uniref:Uncharacterized protein n=1 Tax=Auriscalpium vulgare TaxID=40419 RepID=A0ACB8RGK6_9AGAM|nr:hypothetical protein FA95DRAFT_1609567 [Auriscalpium vulgare]
MASDSSTAHGFADQIRALENCNVRIAINGDYLTPSSHSDKTSPLETLSLTGHVPRTLWTIIKASLSSLNELNIYYPLGITVEHNPSLTDCLSRSKNLQSLCLSYAIPQVGHLRYPIKLPKLQLLTLHGPPEAAANFLRLLHVEAHTRFVLELKAGEARDCHQIFKALKDIHWAKSPDSAFRLVHFYKPTTLSATGVAPTLCVQICPTTNVTGSVKISFFLRKSQDLISIVEAVITSLYGRKLTRLELNVPIESRHWGPTYWTRILGGMRCVQSVRLSGDAAEALISSLRHRLYHYDIGHTEWASSESSLMYHGNSGLPPPPPKEVFLPELEFVEIFNAPKPSKELVQKLQELETSRRKFGSEKSVTYLFGKDTIHTLL